MIRAGKIVFGLVLVVLAVVLALALGVGRSQRRH